MLNDFRIAVRGLRRRPAFALVSILTLAAGIGANSAIFSVVDAVLLKPFPYREPDRLVMLNHNYPKTNLRASVSIPGWRHYRQNAKSFEELAAVDGWSVNLTSQGEPERLQGARGSVNLLRMLGVLPEFGRDFRPEEEEPGKHRVAILSNGLWERRFGADPAILDRTIQLNGETYTIVGVLPAGFDFGSEFGFPVDLWAPLAPTPTQLSMSNFTNEHLTVVGRLASGVSLSQSQDELNRIADQLRREYFPPGSNETLWGLLVRPFDETVVEGVRPALLMLSAIVALVLLIACVNVANLLLARAAERQREVAVRTAMGGHRRQLLRLMVVEGVTISLIAGGLGLIAGQWTVQSLIALVASEIPRAAMIEVNAAVLAFTFAVAIGVGLLFGVLPAFQVSSGRLYETLKDGGRAGTGIARSRVRRTLVGAQVAIAVVVLVACGLLVRSFVNAGRVQPGFDPDSLLVFRLALPAQKYTDPPQRDSFALRVVDRLREIPGVTGVGLTSILPMSGMNNSGSFRIEGRIAPDGEPLPHGDRWAVSTDYFATMRIPLLRGRFFTDADNRDGPGVVIVDETLARKYWPNEDPVGRRIAYQGGAQNPQWREIVGVVGHVKHAGLDVDSRVQVYVPNRQIGVSAFNAVLRVSGDPSSVVAMARSAVREVDPELPVFSVSTMDRLVTKSFGSRTFSTLLLSLYALLALMLAVVGIYGVVSHSVMQRTQESGLRLALGAQPRDILSLLVREAMTFVIAGLAVGMVGAALVARAMQSLLFGVQATDPTTYAVVAIAFVLVGVGSSALPARRATRVSPVESLRHE